MYENRGLSKEAHKALKKRYSSTGSTTAQPSPALSVADILDALEDFPNFVREGFVRLRL